MWRWLRTPDGQCVDAMPPQLKLQHRHLRCSTTLKPLPPNDWSSWLFWMSIDPDYCTGFWQRGADSTSPVQEPPTQPFSTTAANGMCIPASVGESHVSVITDPNEGKMYLNGNWESLERFFQFIVCVCVWGGGCACTSYAQWSWTNLPLCIVFWTAHLPLAHTHQGSQWYIPQCSSMLECVLKARILRVWLPTGDVVWIFGWVAGDWVTSAVSANSESPTQKPSTLILKYCLCSIVMNLGWAGKNHYCLQWIQDWAGGPTLAVTWCQMQSDFTQPAAHWFTM